MTALSADQNQRGASVEPENYPQADTNDFTAGPVIIYYLENAGKYAFFPFEKPHVEDHF